MVLRRLVPFGIPLLATSAILGACLAACSKDNAAIGAGGECYFATDCAPGLVCVEQRDRGTRICTDDLSGVAGEPPGMGEVDASGEGGEAGEAGQTDGPVVIPDADPDQNVPPDTGPPDTGVDTGLPLDSGAG